LPLATGWASFQIEISKNMKVQIGMILTLLSMGGHFVSTAQPTHYTTQEIVAIHDSIRQSRWDIGGNLSKYSFRYMSEFFPVGIISKSHQPYKFGINP
jgi:hypothetical protein